MLHFNKWVFCFQIFTMLQWQKADDTMAEVNFLSRIHNEAVNFLETCVHMI